MKLGFVVRRRAREASAVPARRSAGRRHRRPVRRQRLHDDDPRPTSASAARTRRPTRLHAAPTSDATPARPVARLTRRSRQPSRRQRPAAAAVVARAVPASGGPAAAAEAPAQPLRGGGGRRAVDTGRAARPGAHPAARQSRLRAR